MNTAELAQWLERHLSDNPAADLDATAIKVTHVLNWGGFVNHSFTVADGRNRYHLKLTGDPDHLARLRQWFALAGVLTRDYHAPKTIGWMDFAEVGLSGLLFEHVDGSTANFVDDTALVSDLIALTDRLHHDEQLRRPLRTHTTKTCFDHFSETYLDRFTADLEVIGPARLSFVTPSLLDWMWAETRRLRDKAASLPAFARPALAAVHGDLHEGNVLVGGEQWFVVDWDDLALGDPALDFAILLWPLVYQGRSWLEFALPETDDAFPERMELYLQAQLLDEVIDSLADYVEAHVVPSKLEYIRRIKRQRHEEALERYGNSF